MTELYLVRNGQADSPHEGMLDAWIAPSPYGREQARQIGRHLLGIVGADRAPLFDRLRVWRSPGRRAEITADLAFGEAGWSHPIETVDALAHRSSEGRQDFLPLHVVRRTIMEWADDIDPDAQHVAFMSRRAILAYLQPVLALSDEAVNTQPGTEDEELIPTGSVTRLAVLRHDIEVIYHGLPPEQAAEYAASHARSTQLVDA